MNAIQTTMKSTRFRDVDICRYLRRTIESLVLSLASNRNIVIAFPLSSSSAAGGEEILWTSGSMIGLIHRQQLPTFTSTSTCMFNVWKKRCGLVADSQAYFTSCYNLLWLLFLVNCGVNFIDCAGTFEVQSSFFLIVYCRVNKKYLTESIYFSDYKKDFNSLNWVQAVMNYTLLEFVRMLRCYCLFKRNTCLIVSNWPLPIEYFLPGVL